MFKLVWKLGLREIRSWVLRIFTRGWPFSQRCLSTNWRSKSSKSNHFPTIDGLLSPFPNKPSKTRPTSSPSPRLLPNSPINRLLLRWFGLLTWFTFWTRCDREHTTYGRTLRTCITQQNRTKQNITKQNIRWNNMKWHNNTLHTCLYIYIILHPVLVYSKMTDPKTNPVIGKLNLQLQLATRNHTFRMALWKCCPAVLRLPFFARSPHAKRINQGSSQ